MKARGFTRYSVKLVIKIRLACAAQNKGKSGGFRLIAVGDRKSQELVLLDIFPKTGTQAKSNISESDLGILLKTYIKERKNDQLVVHDLKKELAEIPKKETSAQ